MAEATIAPEPARTPAFPPTETQRQEFEDALAAKLEQGYRLESRTDLDAVIFTEGRRKWFGMVAGTPGRRRRISIHDDGSVRTRGL